MNYTNKFNIIVAILGGLMGIFIVMVSFNYFGEIPLDNIKITQGHFVKYYDKIISKYPDGYICMDDGNEYEIESVTFRAFDREKFLKEVKTDDLLRLSYYADTNLNSDVSYNLISVDLGNKNFMNLQKSQNARYVNQIIGIILGSAFLLISIMLVILSIIRKK